MNFINSLTNNQATVRPSSGLPPPPPLPPGWVKQLTFDLSTGVSHWVVPPVLPPQPYQQPPLAPQPYQQPPPSPQPYQQPPLAPQPYQQPPPSPQPYQQPGQYPVQPQGQVPPGQEYLKQPSISQHYNLNSAPQAPPSLQPYTPGVSAVTPFIPASAVRPQSTQIPDQYAVQVVDPTEAIALELSQSVPSLMKAPPPGSKKEVLDAWRRYLRRIQDAQNAHTRSVRDAQVSHDRAVKDAHHRQSQRQTHLASNAISSVLRFNSYGLGSAATNAFTDSKSLQQELDDAKIDYNRAVEHSAQRLNDSVEHANRDYEDELRRFEWE